MLVRLLGAVQVADGAGWVRAGPAKQACVLAALALSPGQPVPIGELIERVWGDAPPPSSHNVLYGHITRLRGLLRRHDPVTIARTGADGYRLEASPQDIDVFRARGLVARAQGMAEAGKTAEALEHWREAGELWRGEALTGIEGDWARHVRAGLLREHLAALSGRFNAELTLGQHTRIIAELYELVTRHPLAEALVGQLMLALYRAGRAAEALTCFAEIRGRLAEELGTEPAPRLRELHQRILRQDPELLWRPTPEAADDPVAVPAAQRPAQLPADTQAFTGRDAYVAELRRHAVGEHGDVHVPVIAVDGMAGVGKTALVVHASRIMAADFPDGQLFLDLHGYTGNVPAVSPADALDRMLRGLGVPGAAIPANVEDRAALYRSTLAGKRMIIVLDNAAGEEQVRPLLPGEPGNLVLVTSRRRLSGLDDVHQLTLEVLGTDDAADLFAKIAGRHRADPAAQAAIAEIVELCGHLPLAVRIAASRLSSRPQWTVVELLTRLSNETRLLLELETGQRSVTAAFAMSYVELDEAHRRMFRLLGLSVGSDFGVHAAAALSGRPIEEAERLLEDLVDAHLLSTPVAGRYHFHDLVRRYALDAAEREETERDRHAARVRLFEFYCHMTYKAARIVVPYRTSLIRNDPPTSTPLVEVSTMDEAGAWFESERHNLAATVDQAVRFGLDELASDTATALSPFFEVRYLNVERVDMCRRALTAARRSGLRTSEARLLNDLATALKPLSRYSESEEHYLESLQIYREIGNRLGAAAVLTNMGTLFERIGRFASALESFRDAERYAREVGDRSLAALVLSNSAYALQCLERFTEAHRAIDEAIREFGELGDELAVRRAENYLGIVLRHSGRVDEAIAAHRNGVEYCERHGMPYGLASSLNGLGADYRAAGRLDEAIACHERALRICRDVHDTNTETMVLNEFGRTLIAAGEHEAALDRLLNADEIAAKIGALYEQGRARHAIADALEAMGATAQAREHLERAAQLYEETGVPGAVAVRERLAKG